MVSPHTALIYTMVLVSAADGDMTDAELAVIGDITRSLPVFKDYDSEQLTQAAGDCAEIKVAGEGQRNRVEQLWYTVKMQGMPLAKTICGERTKYERGI